MTTMDDYRMVVDFWRFWKDHTPPEDSQQYFDRLIDDADQLWHAYNHNELLRGLLGSLLQEFERRTQKGETAP